MADDVRGDNIINGQEIEDRIEELRDDLGLDRIEEIKTELEDLETEREGFDQTDPENQTRLDEIIDETQALTVERDGLIAAQDDGDLEELAQLQAFVEEAEGYADDRVRNTVFIRESHFTDYAQELAEDIGAINEGASWPNNCIDWDKAASELKIDYTSADLDGVTYYFR